MIENTIITILAEETMINAVVMWIITKAITTLAELITTNAVATIAIHVKKTTAIKDTDRKISAKNYVKKLKGTKKKLQNTKEN
ncbi:hypothetical protein JSY36_03775 [Bacillus sp. H-16]|uniref:hypothetical protein n=1 Tax=Alteribacter salitolerans TaxID=2912333 RepID=UPI0019656E42|nr:hypothetical protein [Alteribacter salitolerans]MBM7094867.1 hypothetical protein [Alteribacter salitolerans]